MPSRSSPLSAPPTPLGVPACSSCSCEAPLGSPLAPLPLATSGPTPVGAAAAPPPTSLQNARPETERGSPCPYLRPERKLQTKRPQHLKRASGPLASPLQPNWRRTAPCWPRGVHDCVPDRDPALAVRRLHSREARRHRLELRGAVGRQQLELLAVALLDALVLLDCREGDEGGWGWAGGAREKRGR